MCLSEVSSWLDYTGKQGMGLYGPKCSYPMHLLNPAVYGNQWKSPAMHNNNNEAWSLVYINIKLL